MENDGAPLESLYIESIYIIYSDDMGEKMLVNLPEKDMQRIETLVTRGEFETKTEVVRFAVKQLLYTEERMKAFEDVSRRLQRQTAARGIGRKGVAEEIEEAKAGTRKLLSRR